MNPGPNSAKTNTLASFLVTVHPDRRALRDTTQAIPRLRPERRTVANLESWSKNSQRSAQRGGSRRRPGCKSRAKKLFRVNIQAPTHTHKFSVYARFRRAA